MKKIVIFNASPFIYGAEKGLINFVKALKDKYEITVILPRGGHLENELKRSHYSVNVKIFPLAVLKFSLSPFYYIGFIPLLILNIVYFFFYVIFKKIDIICSNSLLLIFPAIVAKLSGRKNVWFIREFFPQGLLNKTLGRYAERFCDTIICQSEAIKNELSLSDKATVSYEPLDENDYKIYGSFSAKEELNLPPSSTVIALISRIHPSKGQYEFIRDIKNTFKKTKNLFLVIAGGISVNNLRSRLYKRNIEKIIREEELKNVFFLGYVEDISKVICAADICVFPFKRKEPFGIAVAEALAFGKKVFYPRSGGLKEVYKIFGSGEDFTIEGILKALRGPEDGTFKGANKLYIPDALCFKAYKDKIAGIMGLLQNVTVPDSRD